MDRFDLGRRLFAEWLGTLCLLAVVVGSGIMGERLAGGNTALALLGNTLPTGAILVVLILVLGPVSGAHFNPAVTLCFALRRAIGWRLASLYLLAQLGGGVCGTMLAHGMFEEPVVAAGATARTGFPQWLGEFTATFGLVATILGCLRFRPQAVPWGVGLFITAGYWFTSSTSFANPAVTVARALTDTFSGIQPAHMPAFILAQLVGAAAATLVFGWLLGERRAPKEQA